MLSGTLITINSFRLSRVGYRLVLRARLARKSSQYWLPTERAVSMRETELHALCKTLMIRYQTGIYLL